MVDLSHLLSVTIALTSTTLQHDAPIELSVSVRNEGNQPLTALNWNSPLDPKADVLGIFQIHDAQEGTPVDSVVVKFSRKLPPPREDLVEIPANDVVTQQVNLRPLNLNPEREYAIAAKGRWQAVWQSSVNDVAADELQSQSGASTGEFTSNEIVVKTE